MTKWIKENGKWRREQPKREIFRSEYKSYADMEKKPPKHEIFDGQRIIGMRTLGSMYDQGQLIEIFLDTKEKCRIEISEFLKIVNGVSFQADKKRVYRRLTIGDV